MHRRTWSLACVAAVVSLLGVYGFAEGSEDVSEPGTKPLGRRPGKVLVLASVDMIKDDFVSLHREENAYAENVKFFERAVETFGLDDTLLSLRLGDSKASAEARTKILERCKDRLRLTYYCSESVSEVHPDLRQQTVEKFEELRKLSGGKVTYELIEPDQAVQDYAVEKTEDYLKKSAAGEKVEEPRRPQSIAELFGKRTRVSDQQIREERRRKAAAIARQSNREQDEVYRELLIDDYQEMRKRGLEQEGILPFTFTKRVGNQARQYKIYSAIRMSYLNRDPEILAFHTQTESLEYELALRTVRLTAARKPIVVFFDARKPSGPPLPTNPLKKQKPATSDYAAIVNHLAQSFDVREIRLKKGDSIRDLVQGFRQKEAERQRERGDAGGESGEVAALSPAAVRKFISCFVVAQPDNLEDRQVYEINRVVSLGVPTIFLVSPFTMDISAKGAASGVPLNALRTGLSDVFRKWGFELGGKILAANDRSAIPLVRNIKAGGTRLPVSQLVPLSVVVTPQRDSIDQKHPLTQNIRGLAFPATAGLELDEETLKENKIATTVLASTPKESWSVPFNPFAGIDNPLRRGQPPGVQVLMNRELIEAKDPEQFRDFIDPLPLAVLLEGEFPFVYEGRPMPPWKEASDGE